MGGAGALVYGFQGSSQLADVDSDGTGQERVTERRYVHRTIDVHAGRGTEHEVVAQLERGDVVHVGSYRSAWWEVARSPGGPAIGYAPVHLFEDESLPEFEIESWRWEKDRDFAGRGTVIYTAVIRNNTGTYRPRLRVEFTTFDRDGRVMDTDFTFATGLSPGGTSSIKGYAVYYGGEADADLQLKP